MTALIILGNPNQYTFTNSIIAANKKSLVIFDEPLSDIFVIHSTGSEDMLQKEMEWKDHLKQNDISQELFINRTLEVTSDKDSVKRFVNYIETIVKGLAEDSKLMIDLTNGTSVQKNLLSIAAYILDITHQYIIDIIKLSQLTPSRGFLDTHILSETYVLAPDSTLLDSLAYLNLSEVIRYKRIIEHHTKRYRQIDINSSDKDFFQGNLSHSIQLKLRGDINKDNAIYRIAASSISASVEDLITLLMRKIFSAQSSDEMERRTFGQKLQIVQSKVEKESSQDIDLEFMRKFNDFMLYLRNSTTHKGKLLTDMEKFKADLSVKMSFPFIEFYTDIIHPILSSQFLAENPQKIKNISSSDIKPTETIYYGIDGDNTGSILEELFFASTDEAKFKKLSKSITAATNEISKFIKNTSKNNSIIFEAGDDILFKGYLDEQKLKNIQNIYTNITSGLTCSIGYGRSFQEVYLALKMAKTQPGKNSIIGIEFS